MSRRRDTLRVSPDLELARRMLDLLVAAYPAGLTRDELALQGDVSKGGTFSDYLRSLTRPGLAEERGRRVFAGEVLFLGVGR